MTRDNEGWGYSPISRTFIAYLLNGLQVNTTLVGGILISVSYDKLRDLKRSTLLEWKLQGYVILYRFLEVLHWIRLQIIVVGELLSFSVSKAEATETQQIGISSVLI
jgi:hypothetical protein